MSLHGASISNLCILGMAILIVTATPFCVKMYSRHPMGTRLNSNRRRRH